MKYMRTARLEPLDQNKRIERAVLVRAWRFSRTYQSKILIYLATIIVAALLGALPPILFKEIIDRAIPRRSLTLLALLSLGVLGLTLGQSALGVLNRYLSASIGEGLIFRLRTALFEHIQQMPIAFFSTSKTGALLSRLNNDVLGAQQTITTLASVLSDVFTLAFTLAFMISLSLSVTLISLTLVPAIILLDRRVGGRLSGYARRQMQANAQMSTMEEERFNVAGALLVTLFGSRKSEAKEFQAYAGAVRDSGVRLAIVGRAYFTALSVLAGLGTVAVYYLGGREVILGALTAGSLVALAQYVGRLYSPLTDLASSRVNLLQALVAFERVFEVLDAPIGLKDPDQPLPFTEVLGEITFENVSFTYSNLIAVQSLASPNDPLGEAPHHREGRAALLEMSFKVRAGQTVALVGRSGAGKTTITNLINRLYDPTSGRVLIDGKDLRDVALQDLHDAIGVVSQDPHLFHDSIVANLNYVNPKATMEEIIEATSAAQIHDLIDGLPDGYDTVVGERGYRLSGGEKQRLSIARVFLKRPRIVILDEATSSLDSENEAKIQRAITEVLSGRTAVVIAHRLSTILSADAIIVVDEGRIVEQGTHSELLGLGGLYQLLYETQFAE